MIAYNFEQLENLQKLSYAKDLNKSQVISSVQLDEIKNKVKSNLYSPSIFVRILLFVLTFLLCGNLYAQNTLSPKEFKPIEVYHSEDLIIIQISDNAFLHTSYLQTNDFGNVPCNGMIVRNSNEVVVFDTPTNNKSVVKNSLVRIFVFFKLVVKLLKFNLLLWKKSLK